MRRWFLVFGLLLMMVGTTVFQGVYAYIPQVQVKTAGTWQGFNMDRVKITAKDGEIIPGFLLYPKLQEKRPVVFLLHGLTDRKEGWLQFAGYNKGGYLTETLLDNGFAVFAIDQRYHGERNNGWSAEKITTEVVGNFDLFFKNDLSDILISLDYLQTNPRISKIGMLGYSLGSIMTFAAANQDARIQTAVTCVVPVWQSRDEYVAPHQNITNIKNIPWLMLMGKKDPYYTPEEAQWLYERIPSLQKKLIFYESGHSLPREYVGPAVDWFKTYLK